MAIKVLMLNRSDAFLRPGGDTVQMVKTKQYLERYGINVDVFCGYPLKVNLDDYDLFHVFNIQTYKETLRQVMEIRRSTKKPIVLSTIYWSFGEVLEKDWFVNFVIPASWKWHYFSLLVGTENAYRFYLRRLKEAKVTQRIILNSVDLLIPNSEGEKKLLIEEFGISGTKVRVIPNGVDDEVFDSNKVSFHEAFKKLGVKDFVLEVGRIEPCKNQIALITQVPGQIPLVFVGRKGHEGYYKRVKNLAALRGNVFFFEEVEHDSLPIFYALAKVHALPSLRETPGLVSLEAGIMGCNIVSTNRGPTYEYFGEHAWYCDPCKPESVKNAVEKAFSATKSGVLQSRIKERFTWKIVAKETLEVYMGCMSLG